MDVASLNVCRICKTTGQGVSVYVEDELDLIEKMIGKKVYLEPLQPEKICLKCKRRLDEFLAFRQLCLQSELELSTYKIEDGYEGYEILEDLETQIRPKTKDVACQISYSVDLEVRQMELGIEKKEFACQVGYSCPICRKPFIVRRDYHRHLNFQHNIFPPQQIRRKIVRNNFKKVFITREELKRGFLAENFFQCWICNKISGRENTFRKHLNRDHQIYMKPARQEQAAAADDTSDRKMDTDNDDGSNEESDNDDIDDDEEALASYHDVDDCFPPTGTQEPPPKRNYVSSEQLHTGFLGKNSFKCWICDKKFTLESSFRNHLYRTHNVFVKRKNLASDESAKEENDDDGEKPQPPVDESAKGESEDGDEKPPVDEPEPELDYDLLETNDSINDQDGSQERRDECGGDDSGSESDQNDTKSVVNSEDDRIYITKEEFQRGVLGKDLFQCWVCSMSCDRESTFRHHLNRVHKIYSRRPRKKTVDDGNNLDSTKEQPPRNYITREQLEQGFLGDNLFQCWICYKKNSREDTFRHHLHRVHNIYMKAYKHRSKYKPNDVTDDEEETKEVVKKSPPPRNYINRELGVLEEDSFKCLYCYKQFTVRSAYRKHLNRVHHTYVRMPKSMDDTDDDQSDEESSNEAPLQPKIVDVFSLAPTEVLVESESAEQDNVNESLVITFVTQKEMNQGVLGPNSFSCWKCSATFTNQTGYHTHMNRVHGVYLKKTILPNVVIKPLPAPEVKTEKSADASNLKLTKIKFISRAKMESGFLGNDRYKCFVCKKIIKRQNPYYAHMNFQHKLYIKRPPVPKVTLVSNEEFAQKFPNVKKPSENIVTPLPKRIVERRSQPPVSNSTAVCEGVEEPLMDLEAEDNKVVLVETFVDDSENNAPVEVIEPEPEPKVKIKYGVRKIKKPEEKLIVYQTIAEMEADYLQGRKLKPPSKKGTNAKCCQCYFQANSYKTVHLHFNQNHLELRKEPQWLPGSCKFCWEPFEELSQLLRHARRLGPQGPFECDYCGEICENKNKLMHHFGTVHRCFESICDQCGQVFAFPKLLQSHLERVHSNNRNFQCTVCKRYYKAQPDLKRHMQRHNGIRRYTCEYCAKQFGDRSDWLRHQVVHTGVYLYYCPDCGKGFQRKKLLTEHNCPKP